MRCARFAMSVRPGATRAHKLDGGQSRGVFHHGVRLQQVYMGAEVLKLQLVVMVLLEVEVEEGPVGVHTWVVSGKTCQSETY